MNTTTHGGKREGAGRPHSISPRKQRPLKASDDEWDIIKSLAKKSGLSTNEYIIKSALDGGNIGSELLKDKKH